MIRAAWRGFSATGWPWNFDCWFLPCCVYFGCRFLLVPTIAAQNDVRNGGRNRGYWGSRNLSWATTVILQPNFDDRPRHLLLWGMLITLSISRNMPLSRAQKMRHVGPKTDTNLAVTSHRISFMHQCRYLRRAYDLTLPVVQHIFKPLCLFLSYTPENVPTLKNRTSTRL